MPKATRNRALVVIRTRLAELQKERAELDARMACKNTELESLVTVEQQLVAAYTRKPKSTSRTKGVKARVVTPVGDLTGPGSKAIETFNGGE